MKRMSRLRQVMALPPLVVAGAISSPSAANAASISGSDYTWGYQTAAGTNTLSSGDTVNVGSGSSNYFLVGVGYNSLGGSGILNASAATTFNVNVGNFYVGVNAFNNPVGTGTGGGGAASSGTLNLGANNTITAATKLVIGGADVEANTGVAGGNSGTITTANGGTTTIYTPLMQLGTVKGNTGTFTLGSNATLNLGTAGSRTALDLGIKLTDFNGAGRTVEGTMNLGASGGVANLNLSSLRLSYNTIHMSGGTLHGTLTLSDSASNKLNVVGAGNVVSIGVASGSAGSFSSGTANGLLTIGDLHADSYIESTNNGTAILIGAKPSGAVASVNGTMDFKKGSMTIKTTGAAIAGGNGTANTSRLNLGETGMVTLKAGASSTDWINGLTVAEIKSGGATIHTNSYNLGISQAFTGAGGLTKDGLGALTLNGSNGYTGTTIVSNGTLALGSADRISNSSALSVAGGTFDLGGFSETVAAVSMSSGAISNGTLTGTSYSFTNSGNVSANLAGSGVNLTKSGAGTVTISSTTNSYSGTTSVTGGELVIDGNISTSSLTTIGNGTDAATLSGSGVVGALTIAANAFHNPGNSPGIMYTGNYTMAGTLTTEINGTTPGITGHDQVSVTGTVSLSGNLVAAFGGGSYVNGDLIFILLNDGADTISGTFAGLAQGATVTSYGGFDWIISYTGNSGGSPTFTGGNDVVLMAQTAVPEPAAAILGSLGMVLLLRRRRGN